MQEHPREGNTETDEDAADAAEAEAAMNETGPSVPWEQVKAELGLDAEPGSVTVTLSGGPPDWDGRTLTYPASVLDMPRADVGALLISDHPPARGDDEDPDPRAHYGPADEGPLEQWHFHGWIPA